MVEYRTHAVVLKSTDLGEADRLISFYTRDFGRIDAVAIGSRRIRAKLAAHLEPLTISYVELAEKNRKVVTTAMELEHFPKIRSDFEKLEATLAFLRRCERLLIAPERDDRMWRFALSILHTFERMKAEHVPLIATYATFGLITMLGYAPNPANRSRWPKPAQELHSRFIQESLTALLKRPPQSGALAQLRLALNPLLVSLPSSRRAVATLY